MTLSASVVVPVKDGARHLAEVLAAVREQAPGVELLVIDSGSRDGSPAIAREAGAQVLEIPPADFGHGRTRNLGAERTSGDIVCFLTQDATPMPGWLDGHREAFALDPRVGATFGPHLPRPETSPMIARELTEFFEAFSPDGAPVVRALGGTPFLSNVNACYRRECWEQVRFPDVPYAEDQAFARKLSATDWLVAYHPQAAVLHAHDYSPLGFMRRYFDEYRGLRESAGHVERIGVRSTVRHVRAAVAADRRWMAERQWPAGRQATWTARAALHHGGRKVFSALGSQAPRLPNSIQRAISLEQRGSAGPPGAAKPPIHRPPQAPGRHEAVLRLARDGPAPLVPPVPGMAARERLHVAVVIPPFRRGSGGHSTIYNLLTRLEERGHLVTTWLYDARGELRSDWQAVVQANVREYFRPPRGPAFKGFDAWFGADVVLATGWDTVFAVLGLDHCRARAYLVQDHEPEFFPASAESLWAHQTYGAGLFCIAAGEWLRDMAVERHGARATHFDLGVDHAIYRPRPVARRDDTVIFYARDATPRRAVPLGLLVLEELHRRRPGLRFVLYGDERPPATPFPYEHLGIATPEQLSWAYSEATVGLSLSLTNHSLIPQEMLACELPVVELAGLSMERVFGLDGPVELAPPDVMALADAIERLLDDPGRRARRAAAGAEFVHGRTWEHAAGQLEAGLRQALMLRELGTEDGAEEAEPPPPTPAAIPAWRPNARLVPVEYHTTLEGTDRLYSRLAAEDVAEVERRLEGSERDYWFGADEHHRRSLAIVFGVWHGVQAVIDKTGLRPDMPPEDVHSMARGPLAAGGAIYYADLLADALRRVGSSMDDVGRGLDFGCSSGRVARALAACWPDATWHGCDPNGDAIAWAERHLPEIRFARSPQDPPLPYEDAFFDFVCAISIWSHYGESAALRWLAEMHRIVRPGGRVVLTTHGLQSVAFYAGLGARSGGQLEAIRRALYRRGFWYAPEFGAKGDWGVKHAEWGTAFFTPEWLGRNALPAWSIEDFAVGQNAGNQDVYVLRRQ